MKHTKIVWVTLPSGLVLIWTLGIKKRNGKEEWDKAFENNVPDNEEKVDFDEAYEGKLKLTQKQVDKLFNHIITIRIKELEKIYRESWPKLRANEKITIISAYFNCPGLVHTKTNFYTNISKYVKTSDKKYLLNAVIEIKENSNAGIVNQKAFKTAETVKHRCLTQLKLLFTLNLILR